MTRTGQLTLPAGRTTRHCLAFDAKEKSIRVHPSTWVLLQKLLRPWRAFTALLALTIPASLSSCSTTPPAVAVPPQTTEASCAPAPESRLGKTMGVPVYHPPLWRRIVFLQEN